MKNIAVLSSQVLPLSQTFIREQVRSLRQWDATLVGYTRVKEGLTLDGVNHELIFDASNTWRQHQWRRVCRLFGVAHPPTVRILKYLAPQLVHVHFGTNAVAFWPSVRPLAVPMLVTLHGADINRYRSYWTSGQAGILARRYPRQLLQLAQEPQVLFVAVSEAIRQRAIEFGIPEDKLVTRYIGIDTEKFSVSDMPIAQRPQRVLFVGRLVEKKGVAYLIRAFMELGPATDGAELVIAGDGPLRAELEQEARASKRTVTFLGAVSSDRVKVEMRQARVFCLPSVRARDGDAEGFPTVLMEAQGSGVPVITSADGGAQEGVLHDETGFVFDQGDVEMLAGYLERLLTDDGLATRLAENASAFVRTRFDIRTCSQKLEALYDQVAAEPSGQDIGVTVLNEL